MAFGLGFFLWRGLALNPQELPSALVGEPVPAFELPSLENPDQLLTQDILKGQVSLLNVWATWCTACRQEHPFLMELPKAVSLARIRHSIKDLGYEPLDTGVDARSDIDDSDVVRLRSRVMLAVAFTLPVVRKARYMQRLMVSWWHSSRFPIRSRRVRGKRLPGSRHRAWRSSC